MDNLDNRQYKLSRTLLSLVGLWPYEESRFVYVKVVVCVFVLGSSLVCQVADIVRAAEFNQDVLLNSLPGVVLSCVSIFKWYTFRYNLKNIKKIIDMIRDNWRSLDNRNEQKIILKYADQGMLVNQIFTCSLSLSICGYAVYLFTSSNSSEASSDQNEVSVDLRITVNCFMDDKTHPYATLLQVYITLVFLAASILGTEITAILFVHQACGFFHVVGYCKMLDNTVGRPYFKLLLMGVASLSLRLVRLSEAMVRFNKIDAIIVEIIIIFTHFMYFFVANYMGQIIIDNSSKLFIDTYNTRWYATSVATQKLLLFIMHCSMKNYAFLIGGTFTACYEGFSTLMRMSFSYFTVIYSTQA